MLVIPFVVPGYYSVPRATVRNAVVKRTIFNLSRDAVANGRGKWPAILVSRETR
jgi:hypothetical protein